MMTERAHDSSPGTARCAPAQGRADVAVGRARNAVGVVFFVHGVIGATWVTFIPTVQQTFSLSSA